MWSYETLKGKHRGKDSWHQSNDIINLTLEAQWAKAEIDKTDYIKLKAFIKQMKQSREWKANLRKGKKNFCKPCIW